MAGRDCEKQLRVLTCAGPCVGNANIVVNRTAKCTQSWGHWQFALLRSLPIDRTCSVLIMHASRPGSSTRPAHFHADECLQETLTFNCMCLTAKCTATLSQ